MTRRKRLDKPVSETANGDTTDGHDDDVGARTPDLGDFTAVWRFLDRLRRGVDIVDESHSLTRDVIPGEEEEEDEPPPSRKQLIKKSVEVKETIKVDLQTKKDKSKK